MPPPRQSRHVLDRLIDLCEFRRSPIDAQHTKKPALSFRMEPPQRTFSPKAPLSTVHRALGIGVLLGALGLFAVFSSTGPVATSQVDAVQNILAASDVLPLSSGTAGSAQASGLLPSTSSAPLVPAPSGDYAEPALPTVASEPPLSPHEVFGFAPYWTLADSSGFDLSGLSTVDYFSVGVNPDGSIDAAGPGWQGYQSQEFIDLIDRAHAAGDRVVITVNDFSQSSLDALTLSAAAAQRLSQSVLFLVKSKSLDGVNLDLEGEGSGDQSGLTKLVAQVSSTLHAADPNYQLTMDTYASSADDPSGFYDIGALNQYVDGFFVMAYQLNLNASPGPTSPLTNVMFSNRRTAQEYAAAVPAAKVLLGLPFFGYDWPTTNGTLSAQADGAPSVISYGQEASSGHPIYWDPVTQTAWTSYQVGQQWHEAFFEDPTSLYLAAQVAQANGLGGVGIWALGMDGSSDQAMVSALDGSAPAQKDTLVGPQQTTTSPGVPLSVNALNSPSTTGAPVTPTTPAPLNATPTTTVVPVYQGQWQGIEVSLIPGPLAAGTQTLLGPLADFTTTDLKFSCLESEPTLEVYAISGQPGYDYVITRKAAGDCVNGAFLFAVSPSTATTTTTTTPSVASTTTTTDPVTPSSTTTTSTIP